MRDKFAPIIEGYDCDGITDPWSFQCEPFYEDGGNGGTMMDGTTVQDVLTVKHRFSWELNVLTMARYNALISAIDSGSEPDTVSAIVVAPDTNTRYITTFHVTLPVFRFTLDINGAKVAVATSPLVLEETGAEITTLVSSATITAYPNRTMFAVGDTLDYTGLVVTETYEGNVTPECTVFPVAGTPVTQAGTIVVTVSYKGESVGTFNVTVAAVVASGEWWTLFDTGLLDIYCVGDMPGVGGYTYLGYDDQITTVIFSNSVTSISDWAFNACPYLTSVIIPDSITSIGVGAFDACGLTGVNIPNSVTNIGARAFSGCRSLINIVIPDSVTNIGASAFAGCDALTSVTIPDGVTSIGSEAFAQSGLVNATIPGSVAEVDLSMFFMCHNLTSIVIEDGTTTIYAPDNDNCSSQSITIPASVTTISALPLPVYWETPVDVYYGGTEEQWIEVCNPNIDESYYIIHYNSSEPT